MISLIKWCVITGSVAALFASVVQAETMYVRDILKITMRAGRGVEYKILEVLESGQEVEVLSIDDEWANVRLQNEKEGWVSGKYLTSEKTSSLVLKKIQEKESLLGSQNSALRTENIRLRDELKRVSLQLAENKQALFVTNKSFETLKNSPNSYVELETKYKEAEKKISLQKNKVENLEEELTRLLRQQNVMWLLAGAGILIVGFIIGYSARRNKNRSSLL